MTALQPTALDLNYLRGELEMLHYNREGEYIEMASGQSKTSLRGLPHIEAAIAEIESLRKLKAVYVMVNKLLSKQSTPVHVDYLEPTPLQPHKGPTLERWHLPVTTNPWCFYHQGAEVVSFHMPLGVWCGPVKYWKPHCVANSGIIDRVHLVVDLDIAEPQGVYSYEGHKQTEGRTCGGAGEVR